MSYDTLLRTFWDAHGPTQLNRPDVGRQYRSVAFYHSPEQQEQALASKARVQARYTAPVVTEIEPAKDFWRAEDHHQQYLVKRGRASCLI